MNMSSNSSEKSLAMAVFGFCDVELMVYMLVL